jgi:hypothetical protein
LVGNFFFFLFSLGIKNITNGSVIWLVYKTIKTLSVLFVSTLLSDNEETQISDLTISQIKEISPDLKVQSIKNK